MRLLTVDSGDDAAAPHLVDELVLADYAVVILQQEHQDIEHLWLGRDQLGAAPKLPPVHVKDMIAKEKLHVGPHRDRAAVAAE